MTMIKKKQKNKGKKNYKYGIFAEKFIVILLFLKGYNLLKWRFKCHYGEIDIIATKSSEIIFFEVKARRLKINIEEVLRSKQIQRVKWAANYFIAKNPKFQKYNLRFDFIEFRSFFSFKHHQNFIS
jgi:putative endonuclease